MLRGLPPRWFDFQTRLNATLISNNAEILLIPEIAGTVAVGPVLMLNTLESKGLFSGVKYLCSFD
jgi:hypothetical protein